MTTTVKVWDLPVRLVHWSFALLVPAMWYTAENHMFDWHTRMGVVLLGLIVFRIAWGFLGTRTARFASFVRGPAAIRAYLGGEETRPGKIGHNPLGALSVLALIGALLTQVSLGLFAGDPYDGATGPLNSLVGVMTADTVTELHETFFYVLVALIALHLGAIVWYAAKQHNLLGPMVGGTADAPDGAEGIARAPVGGLLVSLLIAFAVMSWVWMGAPPL